MDNLDSTISQPAIRQPAGGAFLHTLRASAMRNDIDQALKDVLNSYAFCMHSVNIVAPLKEGEDEDYMRQAIEDTHQLALEALGILMTPEELLSSRQKGTQE